MSTAPAGGAAAATRPARPDRAALVATRSAVVTRVLLPRGREQVYKWMLIPVGALLAVAVRAELPTLVEVVQLVLLWFVTEQLGYQARYQLNDLRDRAADAAHPAGAARGRLGFPWTPQRAALVWGSVAVRAVLAVVAVQVLLHGRFAVAGGWFLVLMVVSSLAYELARERVRRERVEPGSRRAVQLGLPVLLCVPLGYGLRVWAGFHALSPDHLLTSSGRWPEALLVAAVLALYAASTLLAWALEGTSFLRGDAAGTVDPALGKRAHIALLVAHVGLLHRGPVPTASAGTPAPGAVVAPTALVVARDRPVGPGTRLAVWDVCAAAAVVLAHSFVASTLESANGMRVVVLLAGLVVAAAPLLARRVRRPGPGPWDERPSWLGGGALALTVGIEVAVLVVLLVVEALVAPGALRITWFLAFVLFAWGSIRTSSYVRGFGPFSLVRRPLQWWRERPPSAPSSPPTPSGAVR